MKTLLIELMNWFQLTGYRKASFDRLLGVLPGASTYDQLNDLVNNYGDYLRPATLKGGFPGLALQENVYPYRVLQAAGVGPVQENAYPYRVYQTEDAGSVTRPEQPILVDPTSPTQPTAEVLARPVATYGGPVVPPAAPMVHPTAMEAEVQSEYYRNLGSAIKAPVGSSAYNVTLCVLILRNGFVIVGKSACVNSANFNAETGARLAREDAIKQITPYLGWRLADARMFATEVPDYKFG